MRIRLKQQYQNTLEIPAVACVLSFLEGNLQMTILIAHRLSTIMYADTIYVLEKENSETGSHAKLIQKKGLHYSMWRQQVEERR